MSAENYEFRIINLQAINKGLYPFFTLKLTTRMELVMEKLTKEGWELTNTTHNAMGFPMVLTFRRPNATNNV